MAVLEHQTIATDHGHTVPDDWIVNLRPKLVSIAARRLSLDIAEDVVQETLLTAVQKKDAYRGEGKFESWLFAILYRKQADYFRRAQRDKISSGLRATTNDDCELISIAESREISPDEKAELNELTCLISRAVTELPPHQHNVLKHCMKANISTQNLADSMNISVQNLWTTLHRARRNLRSQIAGYVTTD